jgi:hypothetical protein
MFKRDFRMANAERRQFLRLAFTIEGGLLMLAFLVAWLLGQAPWIKVRLAFDSVALGMAATIPLLMFLAFTYFTRIPGLVRFRELTRELLHKPLVVCGWLDLCAVALSAGVAEEFMFRGVLEPWLSPLGTVFSILVCNLIFGLCHALTVTYFVFATVVGIYLSLTMKWTVEPNLVIPICCHALYDFAAFIAIRNSFGKRDERVSPNDDPTSEPEIASDQLCP